MRESHHKKPIRPSSLLACMVAEVWNELEINADDDLDALAAIERCQANEGSTEDKQLVGTILDSISTTDWGMKEHRAINHVAYALGLLDVYNPTSVCTRKLPTITINGIKYERFI